MPYANICRSVPTPTFSPANHNVIRLEEGKPSHNNGINFKEESIMARRSNKLVVPECANAINQMKYEIASELGVQIGQHAEGFDTEFAGELGSIGAAAFGQAYLGDLSSREAGSLGGGITKRLIQQAQQTLL
jgi:hypothetical protein